ncbi:MAG: hypothetical protein B9J98_01695 [Candidatus Terraquivivens tikiterensis]|uniref:Uncharacterized protein n=1 Tax=Candidatus Terraquivivens tikiterensis TaxID=1980982 RepID=A0A2R7Y9B4_9ARCH|nr:MAG: hypothetical protein B9J98_01695 [Candidatus Terraquivivens tikiterensis]
MGDRKNNRRCIDPLAALKDIVGDCGEVAEEYGGYRIEVTNHITFPWASVFKLLLRLGHEVWVDTDGEKLFVVSKPRPD